MTGQQRTHHDRRTSALLQLANAKPFWTDWHLLAVGSALRQNGHWRVRSAEGGRRLTYRCLESVWCLVDGEAGMWVITILVTIPHSNHIHSTSSGTSFCYHGWIFRAATGYPLRGNSYPATQWRLMGLQRTHSPANFGATSAC